MFSYCENNPVNMSDVNGQGPWSILTLADYSAIHAMVQIACTRKYGWISEVYVKGARGKGYLDLYDSRTRMYYEVKSLSASKRGATATQMMKYDVAKIADSRNNRARLSSANIGTGVKRGTQSVYGSFSYGIYDITYRSQSPGLIVYDVSVNWHRATAVASIAITAALMIAFPAGIPLYA